jgi:hypothetical protein
VKLKWCRPDTIVRPEDVRWLVVWYRPCSEMWSPIHDYVEWHGMVDGTVVYWHCPPGEYPRLVCAEFDAREGLERLLETYKRDRPAKVYCEGELPPELLAICGGEGSKPTVSP